MDPATLALILSGLAQATRYGFELAELLRARQAGEIDDDEALKRFLESQSRYKGARDAWDMAKPPSPRSPP